MFLLLRTLKYIISSNHLKWCARNPFWASTSFCNSFLPHPPISPPLIFKVSHFRHFAAFKFQNVSISWQSVVNICMRYSFKTAEKGGGADVCVCVLSNFLATNYDKSQIVIQFREIIMIPHTLVIIQLLKHHINQNINRGKSSFCPFASVWERHEPHHSSVKNAWMKRHRVVDD